jgi:hypothetical protein
MSVESTAPPTLASTLDVLRPVGLNTHSWNEFRVALRGIESATLLTAASSALLQGPGTPAIFQAMRLVEARKRELATGVPNRMLGGDATLGLEFQVLGSRVEVIEPRQSNSDEDEDVEFEEDAPAEEIDLSQAAVLPTRFYGRDRRWYVVADGDDLEYVTTNLWCEAELMETMEELVAVAAVLRGAQPGSTFLLRETVVRVHAMQPYAQPQVNADVPLDGLDLFLADLGRSHKGLHEDFFGIDSHFWRSDTTAVELAQIQLASTRLSRVPATDWAAVAAATDESTVRTVAGMFRLMAIGLIHQLRFGTKLEKDQPILHKTSLPFTWQALRTKGFLRADATLDDIADILVEAVGAVNKEPPRVRLFVRAVLSGKDPVWGTHIVPRDVAAPEDGWTASAPRQQVVLELRRVIPMPVHSWVEFASHAFNYAVSDGMRADDRIRRVHTGR